MAKMTLFRVKNQVFLHSESFTGIFLEVELFNLFKIYSFHKNTSKNCLDMPQKQKSILGVGTQILALSSQALKTNCPKIKF